MKLSVVWTSLFALAGCGDSLAKGIDPSKDLDCAMVFLHVEKNATKSESNEFEDKSIYVFRTWYFKNISRDQASDGMKIVNSIKAYPKSVLPAMKTCTDRALKDPGFDSWAKLASREFDASKQK